MSGEKGREEGFPIVLSLQVVLGFGFENARAASSFSMLLNALPVPMLRRVVKTFKKGSWEIIVFGASENHVPN